ncbi:biotin/lipoyl-binding protein [Microbulbifer sp. CAU 1566]|uniref:HlyD family secretion protein n=1 Tax=Microbulbifer sp. CAU 1566 TaxID=2933269 RepID=UPI002002EAAF|nr:biotin/lipoyl-binding protein [Microbulbifer sp. CAU 1566]MCK7596156.1 biotin/lipoyl-binding protein [Microbulbifer sp. CAU 1566]
MGTLEWDRIALPAPVAEKIIRISVREGQRVTAGQLLLELDPSQTRARLNSLQAAVARQEAELEELNVGPRVEEIARARASLDAAEAEARDRAAEYQRLLPLSSKNYVSKSDLDRARASADSAKAQVQSARQQLLELERGTRSEEIQQGQAALSQARAEADAQRVLLEKLAVRAPRAGIVDSIPFKLGDEAPIGGSLVVMLTGDTPYARVYVPQPMRLKVQVGGRAQVTLEQLAFAENEMEGNEVEGKSHPRTYEGRVRMVRNVPSFTPYYALTGDDVSRLSYLAEIQLQRDAAGLPAGLPLRVEFVAVAANRRPQEANATTEPGDSLSPLTPASGELLTPDPPSTNDSAVQPEHYDGGK